MIKIDCHTHITKDGRWFNTNFDASSDALLKQLDTAGIEKSVLLPLKGIISNAFVYDMCKQYPDRFIGFGTASCHTWKEDKKEIIDLHLKGIKLHPRLQNETIDQWDEHGILAEIEELSLPMLICGWQQTSSVIANMEAIRPIRIDRIAKKYPNLRMIIAHMGGHNFWEAFTCARSNPNVFLDCSFFLQFFRGTSLESDFWTMYKQADEKIIFGTDFPEVSIPDYKLYMDKVAQSKGIDIHKMYSLNIQKLVSV